MNLVVPVTHILFTGRNGTLNGGVSLVTHVPHPKKCGRNEGDDDCNHHPFQVDVVTNVGFPMCDFTWRVKERVKCLVHRVSDLQRSAFVKKRMDFVQSSSKWFHCLMRSGNGTFKNY